MNKIKAQVYNILLLNPILSMYLRSVRNDFIFRHKLFCRIQFFLIDSISTALTWSAMMMIKMIETQTM